MLDSWDLAPYARTMLVKDEGVREKPYQCPGGHLTIGVGHNLDSKGLSQNSIVALLNDDIDDARNICINIFGASLFESFSDLRKLALVNLAFNLGAAGLASFNETIAHIKAGEWDDAAKHILKSKYAKQVGKRAERVALMLRNEGFPYE